MTQQAQDVQADPVQADPAQPIDPVVKAATIADQITELQSEITDRQTAIDALNVIAADPAQDAPPSVADVLPESAAAKKSQAFKDYFSGLSTFAYTQFINPADAGTGKLTTIADVLAVYSQTNGVAAILKAYGGQ